MEKLEKTAAALRRRGFESVVFETAKEAADYLLSDMPAGETVGFGGCMTAKQMGLETLLRAAGHKVLWHWEAEPAERPALLHEAMNAPLYVCSANAVTEDGLMVQIDGTGNRIAAMLRPRHGLCSSAATRSFPAAMRRRSSASRKFPARSTRAGSSSITRAPRSAAATPPNVKSRCATSSRRLNARAQRQADAGHPDQRIAGLLIHETGLLCARHSSSVFYLCCPSVPAATFLRMLES